MRHPVDYEPSQDFGDNPTKNLPFNHWIIVQFGNYQPDGHTGTDYPCPVGTPVRAVADGVVLHVGRFTGTYADNPWWISPNFAGFTYVVDHGHFIGIYGHCKDDANWVHKGDRVKEGWTLGLSGNTGASTGPHLHFEALPDGYVLNSYMYGRINPSTLFGSSSLAPAGDINPQTSEEYEVITEEDIQKIAERVRDLIMFDNKGGNTLGELISEERDHHRQVIAEIGNVMTNPMIHPVQAEGIVSSTVERIAAKLDGRIIDAGQADDIARAAARYNQEHDAEKEEGK